jgi:serine/threonine protein phosphatase PrpC
MARMSAPVGGNEAAFDTGFKSDVGQQRTANEDAGAVFDLPGADTAFVVCDGMGGLRAGAVAANEAVRTVRETLTERFGDPGVDPIHALAEALRRANEAVNTRNREENAAPVSTPGGTEAAPAPPLIGTADSQGLMGSTCVAGVVRDDVLYLAHAGDSRAYLLRRGHLIRLTNDHSFVAERVRAGDMTEAEARVSRFRNIVTRGLGIEEAVEPELHQEPLRAGDLLIACSDGLTTMLDDPEIADLLNTSALRRAGAERVAAALVDAANRQGGSDNITVVALRVPGADSGEAERFEETPHVLDIDAPRSRRPPPPALMILLGAALGALLLFLLFALVPALRQRISGTRSAGGSAAGARSVGDVNPSGPRSTPLDYAQLVYDPPIRFAEFLARGDLLANSRDAGLYFVAASSGKVALLSRTGVALKSIDKLEVADAPTVIPSTRVFMAADPQGNVYLSYTKRKVVEKKGVDGHLLATITGFERPEAVAVDEEGNVFVVDFNEIKVCRAHRPKAAPTGAALRARSDGGHRNDQ